MIFSRQNKVLFTHVSRTGGMTITNHLRTLWPDSTSLLGQHSPLVAARAELGALFETSFKFAFVRNPWDRFVSWYSLLEQATHPGRMKGNLGDPESDHWKGFDSFLELWSAQEMLIEGVPRRRLSQWAQLVDADGNLLADDLGHFETLAEDGLRIFAKAGLPSGPLPVHNASTHRHYSAYYTRFGRELVAETFPEDVGILGYRFEAAPAKAAVEPGHRKPQGGSERP